MQSESSHLLTFNLCANETCQLLLSMCVLVGCCIYPAVDAAQLDDCPNNHRGQQHPLNYLSVDTLQTIANLETRPCNCLLVQLFLATVIRQHLHVKP